MSSTSLNDATVTLVWDSMGRPSSEQVFRNQTVRILIPEAITKMSVDGRMSIGNTATCVEWFGRARMDLQYVAHINITDASGASVSVGNLSGNQLPEEMQGGVRFWIDPAF